MALALTLFLVFFNASQAAMITINNTLDAFTDKGNCKLTEAIIAANTDAAVDRCAAGSGTDQVDQIQGVRSVYECDIGAYEFLESSPDNISCQSNLFVISLTNVKSAIVEL